MKIFISKIKGLYFLLSLILFMGCSKQLTEETFGVLSPDTYYKTEAEALSSVVGVYQRMSVILNYNSAYRTLELGTDEFVMPARTNGGWFDGGIHLEFTNHKVTPANSENNGSWVQVFAVIGAANAVLQSLESSPQAPTIKGPIAEVRALRAYAYFYAMDLWGNVPIFTDARVDPLNLPKTNTRKEVFDFVEKEMLKAIVDLPSITQVNRTAYYPRFTKEAIYGALATVYLNGKVFTGTDYLTQADDMCNKVISSGGYKLEPNFITSFTGDNDKSLELISSFSIDPTQTAGANNYVRGALAPLHQLVYNLPFVPANGYATFGEALDRYETNDVRRKYILYGPQTYLDGVTPLLDAKKVQFSLVPIKDPTKSEENEGYRVLKYIPDGKWVARDADNDIVLMRYSDILLIKAEALFRTGKTAEALVLVNQVRVRSSATPLTTLTLQNLEDERGREFLWEGTRRRDMIRFGDFFTGVWQFHTTVTAQFRSLYPIPSLQTGVNANLIQNPGY